MASTYNLDDVGTRYQHYADLLGLFEYGLQVLDSMHNSPTNKERLKELNSAVKLVRIQMDILGEYDEQKWRVWRSIGNIPKADDIKGGRGTPLNSKENTCSTTN